MKTVRSLLVVVIAALATMALMGVARGAAQVPPTAAISDNLAGVPAHPQVDLTRLPAGVTTVSAVDAIAAAKADWALSDSQVDYNVGVVRALVNVRHDKAHQNIDGLIVVANLRTYNPAPDSHVVYNKMVIVVDAVTGEPSFSYAADPVTTS
jgi:hypothetical protein